jgi:hypothetical protein
MVETRIQLTETEMQRLRILARTQDKTPTDLIKKAVTHLANQVTEDMLRQNLMTACGIWRDRQDIVDLRELRHSFDRFAVAETTE